MSFDWSVDLYLVAEKAYGLLLPDLNDHECPRFGPRPACGSRFQFGRWKINPVILRVEAHGPCTVGRLHSLLDIPLATLCVGYCQGAVTAACKRLPLVEASCIDASSNGKRALHCSIHCVHHDQLLRIATADEEMMSFDVDCHSNWVSTRSNRPTRDHFAGVHIDDGDKVFVLQVDVYLGSIGREKLRLTPEIDWGFHLPVLRVNVGPECHESATIA